MQTPSNTLWPAALIGAVASAPVFAGDAQLKVEIPRLNVAEYHRPYVAVWVESADRKQLTNLAVWYDVKMKNDEGTKWLKDLRQWWRRIGREMQLPAADGVTGATRAPGEQTLNLGGAKSPLARLPAGEYRLMVEAAREVGGREILEIPFQWPAKQAQELTAKGEHELGAITLNIKP